MKKNVNKLATLALTGMMMAGMSFSALAADGDSYTVRNSFSFDKYLQIVGGDNVSVPHVTFTFSAEPYKADKADGEMLNTESENTLNVYNGITGNAERKVTGDVTFTGSETKSDSKVKEVATLKNGNSDVVFTQAGVYRYKVSETFEAAKNSDFFDLYNKTTETGGTTTVTQSSMKTNKNKVNYIDVYVQYDAESSSYKITNVVLMTEDPRLDGVTVDADNKVDYGTAKLAGVENLYSTKHTSDGKPGEDDDDEDNAIILTKKLGTTGFQNNSKDFTFTVKFTNVPSDFVATYAKKTAEGDYGTAETNTGDTLTVTLKANETVKITGIPVGIKYEVTETSDSNYTPSIKFKAGTDAAGTYAEADEDGGTDRNIWTLDERTLSDALVDNIEWTNTQNEITVTGVAMDVAPYAAMVLGAGAFAGIFLGGKRRRAEDED